MGDLVRDRRAADEVGREDQPPAVADRARARAASPARDRIADADPRRLDAGLRGKFASLAAEQVERMRLQPAQQPALEPLGRAAGDQPALAALDPPRPRRVPVEPVRQRRGAARSRPARTATGSGIAASARSTQARWPAAQASARRCEIRFGTVSSHRAGARIDAGAASGARAATPRASPALRRASSSERRGRRDDVRDRQLHPPRSSSRAPTCRPRAPSRGSPLIR